MRADFNAAAEKTRQSCRKELTKLLKLYPALAPAKGGDSGGDRGGDGDGDGTNAGTNSNSDLQIKEGELAGEKGVTARGSTRTTVSQMLESIALGHGNKRPLEPVENDTQDQQKVVALLQQIYKKLTVMEKKQEEMSDRLAALEALLTSTKENKVLQQRLACDIRKALRSNGQNGGKKILFMERIKDSTCVSTWWAWLGSSTWTKADKTAVGEQEWWSSRVSSYASFAATWLQTCARRSKAVFNRVQHQPAMIPCCWSHRKGGHSAASEGVVSSFGDSRRA
jgi:hypothetical protein